MTAKVAAAVVAAVDSMRGVGVRDLVAEVEVAISPQNVVEWAVAEAEERGQAVVAAAVGRATRAPLWHARAARPFQQRTWPAGRDEGPPAA